MQLLFTNEVFKNVCTENLNSILLYLVIQNCKWIWVTIKNLRGRKKTLYVILLGSLEQGLKYGDKNLA